MVRDELGSPITAAGWLNSHQGGDAINGYGINAIRTHLGCVVPWDSAPGKFICLCHGSQYDDAGLGRRGISRIAADSAMDFDGSTSQNRVEAAFAGPRPPLKSDAFRP